MDLTPSPPEARPRGLSGALRRLPISMRLTLIFAVGMVFVLALSGVVVFERVRSQVDSHLNLDVSRQAEELLARVAGSPAGLVAAVSDARGDGLHTGVAQVLDSHGRVLAATPGSGRSALLSGRDLRAALRHRTRTDRATRDRSHDSLRLLSTPVRLAGYGNGVLVVGTSLDQRSESLSSLTLALIIVGPIALLLVTAGAYRLTRATLRPVELMQRRAATVSAQEPGVRLPLPPADDEIRALGSTLNEMLERLEDSFAREQTFVANASHELRTPLANLKVELELALRRPRSAAELVEALRSVQGEVDRLSDLTDDLLVIARADDGRLPLAPESVPVRELFETVRSRAGAQAPRVRVNGASDLLVRGDPRRLQQAFTNLIDNALRYSAGEVLLTAERDRDGAVALHVTDHGPGFPEEFVEHAFERFSRADPGRAGRGAGLGLALVQMIAHAHGGEAHVANRPSGGADVWVVIPGSPGD